MAFFRDPPRYHTLLVTFWEERNQDPNLPNVWRFRLEDPRTGRRWGFANLEALVEALKCEVSESDEEQSM
jgi:hypothetical protein